MQTTVPIYFQDRPGEAAIPESELSLGPRHAWTVEVIVLLALNFSPLLQRFWVLCVLRSLAANYLYAYLGYIENCLFLLEKIHSLV